MQYCLLSKFKGALLGAYLGNYIGSNLKHQVESNQKKYKLFINKHEFCNSELNKRYLQKWGEITAKCANSLIRKQEFNQEDWQRVYEEWRDNWNSNQDHNFDKSQNRASQKDLEKLVKIVDGELSNFQKINLYRDDLFNPTASNGVIASLPVALLYHEDELKLQQKLQQWGKVWQNYLAINLSNLAIGYVIAQALTDRIDPLTLIPKIIDYIGEKEPLVGQLREVEKLIHQGVNIDGAITRLSKNVKCFEKQQVFWRGQQTSVSSAFFIPISLALYCFLSTPEDLGLAVLRAARTRWGTQTSTIVGTLSGAFNSNAGVPVEWRQRIRVELLGMNDEAEIMKLAKSLWALWCGVYHPNNMTPSLVPVVAASNFIHPRSGKRG